MIEELTPEQEALIPVYREKWRAIALSTDPFEYQTVSSIADAYIKNTQEDLIFFHYDSPYEILSQALPYLGNKMWGPSCQSLLQRHLIAKMVKQIERRLWRKLRTQLTKELENKLWKQLWRQIQMQLWNQPPTGYRLDPCLTLSDLPYLTLSPYSWICTASLLDFCISVLSCKDELIKWEVFQSAAINFSGGIFLFKNALVVCSRPTSLSFDDEQRLHAEGSPAIQFADGYNFYCHHGVTLSE